MLKSSVVTILSHRYLNAELTSIGENDEGGGTYNDGMIKVDQGDTSVVLKLASSTKNKTCLEHEFNILEKLSHPSVVDAICFIEQGKISWIEMELIEGLCMFDLIADVERRFNDICSIPDSILELLSRRIFQALYYLSTKLIVHNDVKPENILTNEQRLLSINENSVIKLCDFGLSMDFTERGSVKPFLYAGSPGYVAPEKGPGFGKNLTYERAHKSDIFSFGCCIFATITGYFFRVENTCWGTTIKECSVCGYENYVDVTDCLTSCIGTNCDNVIKFKAYNTREEYVEYIVNARLDDIKKYWNISIKIRTILEECFVLDVDKRKSANEFIDKFFKKENHSI